MTIIYPVLIDTFIANINPFIKFISKFFILFFYYMNSNSIFKNTKVTKIKFFIFEILVFNNSAFVNKILIL